MSAFLLLFHMILLLLYCFTNSLAYSLSHCSKTFPHVYFFLLHPLVFFFSLVVIAFGFLLDLASFEIFNLTKHIYSLPQVCVLLVLAVFIDFMSVRLCRYWWQFDRPCNFIFKTHDVFITEIVKREINYMYTARWGSSMLNWNTY